MVLVLNVGIRAPCPRQLYVYDQGLACVSVYNTVRVYAVALTRLDRLHFPDERILMAIRQ